MKTTGYDLRNALTKLTNRKALLLNQWTNSQYAFEGEEEDPKAIFEKIAAIEGKIVKIQLAQDEYNQKVTTVIGDKDKSEQMSLGLAIKMIGATKRLTNLWKKYAQDSGTDIYGRRSSRTRVRNAENEEAKRVIPALQCMENYEFYQEIELALSNAIAKGNAETVDLPSLSASDLNVEA